LRYFLAAGEEQNFRRAATRMKISQASLSRQVQELERELGVSLFVRERQRVRLAPAGTVYLQAVRSILRDLNESAEKAQQVARGLAGSLRLGLNYTACRCRIVPESFRKFREEFPGVELSLLPMWSPLQRQALGSGEIDAGFMYDAVNPSSGFCRRRIAEDRMVLAVPLRHSLARRGRIKLADLIDEPFVWVPSSATPPEYARLNSACHAGGLSPRIVYEVLNEETRLNLVTAGIGLAFVISPVFANSPDIVFKEVSDLSVIFPLEFIWKDERDPPPSLIGFVKIIEQLTGQSSDATPS